MTSIGTISAIGLIPLWLYLFSSSYTVTDGTDKIDVPYGPICRTLSILITALFLGIAFRRFSPRIGNGFILINPTRKYRILNTGYSNKKPIISEESFKVWNNSVITGHIDFCRIR